MIGPAVTSGLGALVLYLLLASPGLANSRLEDSADFEGMRDNLLVGHGLVVAPGSGVEIPLTALGIATTYRGQTAALLTEVEQLRMQPDQPARVVIDERSGIIAMGAGVRISQVAVAHGNLTVRVTETPQASQPHPLAEGDTVVEPRTSLQGEESGGNRAPLEQGVSLDDLVAGLSALGVGTRDLIAILRAIKAAGALHAEIVVM
jgi:flagellar P-ring protein precursor FlgI